MIHDNSIEGTHFKLELGHNTKIGVSTKKFVSTTLKETSRISIVAVALGVVSQLLANLQLTNHYDTKCLPELMK